MQIMENGKLRDATPAELAEFAARAAEYAMTASPRNVTKLGFRNRFAIAEKIAIEMGAVSVAGDAEPQAIRAATLRVFLADLAAAEYVNLDSPAVINGVQTLEAFGVIAAGRSDAILLAAIQPSEVV